MTSSGDLNLKTIDGPGPVHIDVVATAQGMDASGYSFAYLAGWAGPDLSLVRQAADTVTQTARRILTPLATAAAVGQDSTPADSPRAAGASSGADQPPVPTAGTRACLGVAGGPSGPK